MVTFGNLHISASVTEHPVNATELASPWRRERKSFFFKDLFIYLRKRESMCIHTYKWGEGQRERIFKQTPC